MTCQIRKERKGIERKGKEKNRSDTNQCQTYDKGDSHRKDGSEADSFAKDLIKGFSDFLRAEKTGKWKLEFKR